METLPDANGDPQPNPLYDPDHVPRYYTIDGNDDVHVYNKGKTWFDADSQTWLGDFHAGSWDMTSLSAYGPESPELDGATVMSMVPASGWLDESTLFSLWQEADSCHPGGPMLLDAFLYTSNSVMLSSLSNSVYQGQAVVNGGMVAADVGVFLPGPGDGSTGLQLNYDDRHQDVMKLNNGGGKIELRRGVRIR